MRKPGFRLCDVRLTKESVMSTASLRLVFGCLVVMLVCSAAPLAAQSITGTIQGVVRDAQSLGVPGATVTARNIDTNVSRDVVTDGEGIYRFLNMPVGNYELTVELSGFSRYVRSGLTLALNQTAVVDVEIKPAARHRNGRSARGCADHQHAERRSRRPVRHDACCRIAGHRQPQHLYAGAIRSGRE